MSTRSSQGRLSFPVRKNTRPARTDSLSNIKKELCEETDQSPLRRSRRNSRKPVKIDKPETPEKKMKQRNRQGATESPQTSPRSPGKRQSESVVSPPTPPKSPCKSVTKSEHNPSTPRRKVLMTPTRKGHPDSVAAPSENADLKDVIQLICQNSPKRQMRPVPFVNFTSPLKSPTKRKSENEPPPPTPPKSPFAAKNLFASGPSVLSPKKHQENVLSSPRKTLQQRPAVCSPKKLSSQSEENFALKSPKKPVGSIGISKPDNKPYHSTKQLLHTAKPDLLVGRDREVSEIKSFLKTHLENHSAGSLYISGAPGTGKTAALLHIIDDFKVQYQCAIGYLNCMTVKDSASVYRKLYTELSGKTSTAGRTGKDMEKLVTSSKDSLILVLDEIDQLDSKNQEVLYRIFEWPYLANSKLILTGVANALDLTDRILPRLQAKPHCRPRLLHFAPYTKDQIAAIITNRLAQCGDGDAVIETSAIQFCARKVSAVAGDMRKALDVCRRAVEMVEAEIRSQQVLRVADCNSPSKSKPPVKKIGIPHISKVLSEVYGSSVQTQQSEAVPLQQKLMVCTLLLVIKSGKFKEVQLGKVYENYCKVCRRQQMAPVDQSEFHSLCGLLEARGIVGMKKAKDTRMIKLTLRQDEKELEQTLQDKVLVSTIIQEGLPK